jgi:hypothetical protein
MKSALVEKNLYKGRLANELVDSEGYKLVHKRLTEKKEQLLKEALDSETIGDLKYNKGFLNGLEFFESTVEQWIQRAEAQRKRSIKK